MLRMGEKQTGLVPENDTGSTVLAAHSDRSVKSNTHPDIRNLLNLKVLIQKERANPAVDDPYVQVTALIQLEVGTLDVEDLPLLEAGIDSLQREMTQDKRHQAAK